MELSDGGTLAILSFNFLDLQDLETRRHGTMTTCHFHIHLLDSSVEGDVTEFLAHVNGGRTGVVTQPDGNVLDLIGLGLEDLVGGQNLTSGLLHLAQLTEEVPETAAGDHFVFSEDLHPIDHRARFRGGGARSEEHTSELQSH